MSMPIGLTHSQANLDAFPHELSEGMSKASGCEPGWYSLVGLVEEAGRCPKLAAQLAPGKKEGFLESTDKPIGNCRSGDVIVVMP
jgi:hypothetical protein